LLSRKPSEFAPIFAGQHGADHSDGPL